MSTNMIQVIIEWTIISSSQLMMNLVVQSQ